MIAILASLAGIGAPRFFGTSEFEERFFADEVRSALAYARKLAVASGCEVRVTIGPPGYELRQRQACDSGAFDQDVVHPAGTTPDFRGAPPTSVALASSDSPIFFDALGRALDTAGSAVDITVTVGTRSLTTVGQTGFVYEN